MLVGFAMPEYHLGEASVVGRAARDFALTLDGKPARLSDMRGKVVVLDFWATWCQPCVEETPSLNELQSRIAPQGGMVLGVSLDEDASAYDQFLAANHVIFPTYRDASKKIALDYGTFMYPETYLIGRDGRIARKIFGPQDWNSGDIARQIETLLSAR